MKGRTRLSFVLAASVLASLPPGPASAQARTYTLESAEGLRLHNVAAEPATFQGKKGLKLTLCGEAARRLEAPPPSALQDLEQLALIDGLVFGDGVIEAELAGTPGPGAAPGARGFVGIAFRVQDDRKTYDAFYLRPTNGRADDQERRNHSAQYVSHPDWPWDRLRRETPSRPARARRARSPCGSGRARSRTSGT
jgi:hypothetical protein